VRPSRAVRVFPRGAPPTAHLTPLLHRAERLLTRLASKAAGTEDASLAFRSETPMRMSQLQPLRSRPSTARSSSGV
jgi:hypothetical protein